jgi:uncharacterized protein YbjT (DUF2867 family)
MKRILLIGTTGRLGREVLAQLPATGLEIRAMMRQPDPQRLPPHVEAVRGDLTEPESVEACLHGIDTVFLVWMAPPATVAPVIERVAHHARRIVYISAPLKTPHPFFQQPNTLRDLFEQIEREIEKSGLEWTFVRPGMFAGNSLLWWARQTRKDDVVRWPYLQAPTAPIDERDIAAVAVRSLCEAGHAGAEYVITGPESLTQYEQVEIVGRAIGRALRIEEMTPDDWRREWIPLFGPVAVNMLLNAWAAALGQPAFVTTTFAEVTGVPARTFVQWAADHAAEFALASQPAAVA